MCEAVGEPQNEEMIKMPCQAFKKTVTHTHTHTHSGLRPGQASLGRKVIYLSQKRIHNYLQPSSSIVSKIGLPKVLEKYISIHILQLGPHLVFILIIHSCLLYQRGY